MKPRNGRSKKLVPATVAPMIAGSVTMNHLGRFGKDPEVILIQAVNRIRQGQMDIIIKQIYERYKNNPMIPWKKEIKKVVGIPVSKINGLDI